ncbi:MAG: hypothetical protein Q4C16_11825, partial [Eubacteriales bacterium]|nr:hypothetical protein [Eubacteriales bacterium]
KYNWLLKKIHSPGGIPLRLQSPAGLWYEYILSVWGICLSGSHFLPGCGMNTFSEYGEYVSLAPIFCRNAEWMISGFLSAKRQEGESAGVCQGAGVDWSWLRGIQEGESAGVCQGVGTDWSWLSRCLSGLRCGRLKKRQFQSLP